MQETLKYWYALLSVLTWVAFLYLIWEHIKDGSVYAMVLSMISSEESDKVQHKLTCHTSITQSMGPLYLLRSRSSLMNPQFSCMFEDSSATHKIAKHNSDKEILVLNNTYLSLII